MLGIQRVAISIALVAFLPETSPASPPAFLVSDLAQQPAPAMQAVQEIAQFGGIAYFGAGMGTTGCEPWKSDGTAAGAVLEGHRARMGAGIPTRSWS